MNKFIITLVVFISLSLSKSSSPVAVSQARAILTADIIFEGEIINLENDEATINNKPLSKLLLKIFYFS